MLSKEEYEKQCLDEYFLEVSPALLANDLVHLSFSGKIKRARISGLRKETGCYCVRCIPADDETAAYLNWMYPEWCDGYTLEGINAIKRWYWVNPQEKSQS